MEAQYIKINENGSKCYFKDKAMTKLHREDGPAVECADGYKAWYLDGKRHREDGPAVERTNGDKAWYLDGKRHREDGAAVEYAGGYKEWHLEGKKYTQAEFKAKMNPTKELTVADIEKLLGHRVKIVKQQGEENYGSAIH